MNQNYSRGSHPNSIRALHEYRAKGLEAKRRNKQFRLMQEEIKKEEKKRQYLDLEIEIFKIKQKRLEQDKYEKEYEKQFVPLSRQNLSTVIKNVFLK